MFFSKKTQPFSRKKLKTADFFRYACYRADVLTTGMGWIRRMALIMMYYRYSYLRAYEESPPLRGTPSERGTGLKGRMRLRLLPLDAIPKMGRCHLD